MYQNHQQLIHLKHLPNTIRNHTKTSVLNHPAKIHQIPSIMQTAVRDGMITMEKSLEELAKSGKIDPGAAKAGH